MAEDKHWATKYLIDLPNAPAANDKKDPTQPMEVLGSPTGKRSRQRATSLGSRFPGDKTHHPLDMLKHETKVAYRSPHLRKKHIPGPDTIDSLDNIGIAYHHEGPYDATLLARNTSFQSSPLQAVRSTNEEALRATPDANIRDSLDRHRPLDGVAVIPPGMRDLSGHEMRYEEGANMMIEDGGNYKRWPGVDYHPNDLKGKGKPSYSLDQASQNHRRNDSRPGFPESSSEYEMTGYVRPSSAQDMDKRGFPAAQVSPPGRQDDVQRCPTTGRRLSQSLRSRFGSLRKRNPS